MARGQAELVTTFEVDANGLLKVTAMDRASGRKASISTSLAFLYLTTQVNMCRHYQLRWSSHVGRDRADG